MALCGWGGTFIGLVIIFLEPHFFIIATEYENYQKLNLGNLHGLIVSMISNAMQICQYYTGAIMLWVIISYALLRKCGKKINFIQKIILGFFPIYSGLYYIFRRLNIITDSMYILVVNTIIILIYLLTALYAIFRIDNRKERVVSLAFFLMGIYSVLPLLIVYPIGARCLFQSYIAMAMVGAINCASAVDQDRKKKISLEILICSMMVLLLGINYRINSIDEKKNSYIKECMRKGKKEIEIPKVNSDYVHSGQNIMISNAFFLISLETFHL